MRLPNMLQSISINILAQITNFLWSVAFGGFRKLSQSRISFCCPQNPALLPPELSSSLCDHPPKPDELESLRARCTQQDEELFQLRGKLEDIQVIAKEHSVVLCLDLHPLVFVLNFPPLSFTYFHKWAMYTQQDEQLSSLRGS